MPQFSNARAHGNTTLDSVSVSGLTINYHEGANSPGSKELGKNIGGFIGYIDDQYTIETEGETTTKTHDNGTIEIKGTSVASPSIVFTGHHEAWNVAGGAIGKVVAEKFNILISGTKLTVGMNTDISGVTNVGEDGNCGGLIGYIISAGSYAERTIGITNLECENCVIASASSSRGGGFLGYAWLNTTATVDGVEVKGTSSINNVVSTNKAENVGVMCYSATGKWDVNSLTVTKMTMNNGGGDSIGMIVNCAYSGNDGLYLNLLNRGYTLTGSGITLPATTSVYDEIAAKTASSEANVLAGGNGTGIVSVDMNATNGTEPKITVTGTYQNRLTSPSNKFANSYTRYYYNLNHMSTGNAGQNLLLYTVRTYPDL